MTAIHAKCAVMFVGVLSVGLLGQTQGCDMGPLLGLFGASATTQGPAGADDHGAAEPGDDHGGQSDDGSATVLRELTASLVGTGSASGHADYQQFDNRVRLNIEVEDAVPGATLDIVVNGQNVGTLTVDQMGEGEVEFDTKAEAELEHTPWPANLPTDLQAGATIQVGDLSGTLSAM